VRIIIAKGLESLISKISDTTALKAINFSAKSAQ